MSQQVKTKTQLWKEFGSWIQQQRKAARKTQAEIAKAAGLDTVSISRIENGLSTKRDTVIAIAGSIPNCDVAEALDRAGFGTGEFEKLDDEVLEEFSYTLRKYNRLSDAARTFANQHFVETIQFLLRVEGENLGDDVESLSIIDESAVEHLVESSEIVDYERQVNEYEEKRKKGVLTERKLKVIPPSEEDKSKLPAIRLVKGKKKKPPKNEGSEN